MSYIYNAAQDPFAMAYQNERNSMLSNPAYNVGNGQFSVGAYGTIGGVPLDMLNLPMTSANAGNIDSILKQFDMQNSGILELGAQLAGPNSQFSNLMGKYQQAVAVEQVREQYKRALQMQEMQTRQLQQQMAMMQQQQMMAASRPPVVSAPTSGGATSASSGSGGLGGNAGVMLALALLLMQDKGDDKKVDDGDDNTTNPPTNSVLKNEDAINEVMKDLGLVPGEYTSLDNKVTKIGTLIDDALNGVNVSDTDLEGKTLEQKVNLFIEKSAEIDSLLARYGITGVTNQRVTHKIGLLTANTQENTNEPIDVATKMATAIGVDLANTGTVENATLSQLQKLNTAENKQKIDQLCDALAVDKSGTMSVVLGRLQAKEAELDSAIAKLTGGTDPVPEAGKIQAKMQHVINRVDQIVKNQTLAPALPTNPSYSQATTLLATLETQTNTIWEQFLGMPSTQLPIFSQRAYNIRNTQKDRINTYLTGLMGLSDTELSQKFNQTNVNLIKDVKAQITATPTKTPMEVLYLTQIFSIMNDDNPNMTLPPAA